MVESERLATGSMPCGRAMFKRIFQYFQLERDRIGMLGERSLLSLRIPGNIHADFEAFRDKYIYVMPTIPIQDQPREQTLFNHVIDELERCSIMAHKVQKAHKAPLHSHRRTTKVVTFDICWWFDLRRSNKRAEPFWAKLTSVVDIEPPEPIYRILGRNHLVMPLNQADGHEECAAFRIQEALIFDMLDYAHQTVDLFISASPTPRAWSMQQHHSSLMAPSQFSMKKLKASWPLMHAEYSWRCCGLAACLDPI